MAATKVSTYEIETDNGTFQVDVQEPSSVQNSGIIGNAVNQTKDILGNAAKRTFQAGPMSFNNLTGGVGTQFAHDVKAYSLEKFLNPTPGQSRMKDFIVPVVAESAAGATDPQTILSSFLSPKGSYQFGLRRPGSYERLDSMKASANARQSVSKLLPSADISNDIKENRPSMVLSEGARIITHEDTPQTIADKFRTEKSKVLDHVDTLVRENNQPISPKAVLTRVQLLLDEQLKNATPTERKKIRLAVEDQARWISEQGDFDAVKAQARKRFLYKETERLQRKQALGKQIVTEPEADLVKDKFAQAYKELIERVHPDIQKANSRVDGLEKGLTAASRLVEAEMEKGSPAERIVTQTVGRPSIKSAAAAGVRELPFFKKTVGSLTRDIENFTRKSDQAYIKSRLQQAPGLLTSDRVEGFPATINKETQTTYQRYISGPTKKTFERIKGPSLNDDGQKGLDYSSFEMVTPEEAQSRLRLEKFKTGFIGERIRNVRKTYKYGK